MKIIVIRDSDGHIWGMAHTPENVRKVCSAALEAGLEFDEDEEGHPLPTGRTFGGICEVIDTEKLEEFPNFNPFI